MTLPRTALEKTLPGSVPPFQLWTNSEQGGLNMIVLLITPSSSGTSDHPLKKTLKGYPLGCLALAPQFPAIQRASTGTQYQTEVTSEDSLCFSHLFATDAWEEAPRRLPFGDRMIEWLPPTLFAETELHAAPNIHAQSSSLPVVHIARALVQARRDFANVIALAQEEVFEDGVQGPFARSLASFIEKYHSRGLAVLESYVLSLSASLAIAPEVLRQIGLLEEPSTRDERFRILVRSLTHRSAIVRDAAGLGLTSLGDKRAIPHIENAIQTEQSQPCREGLKQVLEDLKSTVDGASPA